MPAVDVGGRFAPRAVCSDVERRAAVWAHDELRVRGHEAWVETHWVRPQTALALALGCALALTGGLIAIGAPVPGLVVAAAGAISVLADVAGRTSPLRLLLPRRATQVVLVAPEEDDAAGGDAGAERPAAQAGATGPRWTEGDAASERPAAQAGATGPRWTGGDVASERPAAGARGHRGRARVDLLLVARTDVPRRGLAARLERVSGGLWWLVLCAFAVVVAAAARVAGAGGLALGIAQLIPTVVLMLAVAAALDAAVAPVGDGGAEDEAIAAAIALYDELARDPPPGIAPGLLLAGPDALRAHLRRERLDPARTALLHVRAGDVRSRHPQWRAAAAHAGVPTRRAGPRGLPAAVAPPDRAEALARALSTTL